MSRHTAHAHPRAHFAHTPTPAAPPCTERGQVAGFAVLLAGTLVYNELIRLPCLPAPAPPASTGWPEALTSPFLAEERDAAAYGGGGGGGSGGRRRT
jgi:hypothetical protein